MSLFYKQNAAARFFVDQTNGKVYEVAGGSTALRCWRNGVKEREKVAELPPGLDELWGGEELAWSLIHLTVRLVDKEPRRRILLVKE